MALVRLIAVLSLAGLASGQTAPRRLALLIGNTNYTGIPALPSVPAELELMKAALEDARFTVTVAPNVGIAQFARVEEQFVKTIAKGDTCLVYYTGYAAQSDGLNFLVGVDYKPGAEPPGYPLLRLQQRLEQSGADLKLIVLESSREVNALLAGASGRGLAMPDLTDLTQNLIAMSMHPNQGDPAAVGRSEAGAFTRVFAELIRQPGTPLLDLFQRLQAKVEEATSGRQRPFYVQNTTRQFYFRDPIKVEATRRAGESFTNPKGREEYAYIPPGTFLMGCVPSDAAESKRCRPEEKPQHKVTIGKGFWMGRTEVQTEAYKRYVEEDKKTRRMPKSAPFWNERWRDDTLPIVMVTWDEAQEFCKWSGGRLPTEAEWEYAARAGAENQVFPLNDETSRDKANFVDRKGNDRYENAAPVKKFDANAFGLFDMAGNVWEWAGDWFSADYYAQSPASDPPGAPAPNKDKERVIRGGGFDSNPKEHLRISYRKGFSGIGNAVGFRCVLEDTPQTRKLLQVP